MRLLGTSISTRRLWRFNAVLAFIVCLEAPRCLTFLMRVGTGTILVAPVVPAAHSIGADSSFAPRTPNALGAPAAPNAPVAPRPVPDAASILAAAKSSGPASVRPQADLAPVIGWLADRCTLRGQGLRERAPSGHDRQRPLSPARWRPPDYPGQRGAGHPGPASLSRSPVAAPAPSRSTRTRRRPQLQRPRSKPDWGARISGS